MNFINFRQRAKLLQDDVLKKSSYDLSLDDGLVNGDQPQPNEPKEGFSFSLFGAVALGTLGLAALTSWLIDPLWYRTGNQLTGQNFSFNERISKTNQFANNDVKSYDCLILGSSRVTALNASEFQDNNCFNYSFKGGWAEDFINVANYVKQQGLNPSVIYVGVDEFNFVKKTENTQKPQDFSSNRTPSPFHAYVSSNVLMFSMMTLGGVSSDPFNYYDKNFEAREFPNAPRFEPGFHPPAPPQECDLTQVNLYQEIRTIFPNAKIIGYVPPRAAWSVINETYNREIMGCVLDGFYQVSNIYDEMHDFSIPSEMTMNPSNTYDGSHFTVEANAQVAAMLESRTNSVGLQVDQLTADAYKTTYMQALEDFLRFENAPQIGSSQSEKASDL